MKVVTHKYGIEIPTSIEHAKELDKKNGNTLWQDALKKEMSNVSIDFDILDHGVKPPPGWTLTEHFRIIHDSLYSISMTEILSHALQVFM